MKVIKKYSFLFKDLNTDEKQILGSVVVMFFGMVLLTWLTSTAVTHRTTKVTTQVKQQNYELPESYNKYANRIYNEKHGK
jgi:hypothetical protein